MRTGVVCKKNLIEGVAPPNTISPAASLDTQFVERANRRLGLVAGVFSGAVAALVLTSLLLYGPLGWEVPAHLPHFLGAQSVLFFLSVAMAVVSVRRTFRPKTLLTVGLVYQVAGALVISICAFHGTMLLQPVMIQVSWLAIWILLFPLFVPGPPVRSLVVSLLCATTAPAVFLTWSYSHGQALPAFPVLAETFVPYYVCAGLAVLPAWLVYDLGTAASKARTLARQLGSYQLVELIGQGGMGEVWRAEHSMLARPAAIKLVHPPTTGKTGTPALHSKEEVLGRFAREAQATAQLTSPHTVSLYDYGVVEDGTLYYAMELLDGLDLEALVQRFGPVSPARTVHFLRQACESLREAHGAGLVHRDIKPANLMASRTGGRVDFIKVLDFGLVRQLRDHAKDPLITDEDCLLGTPAFMAPELVNTPDDVDGRADIYALGCVAYWLLTGAIVFEQPTIMGIVADHVHTQPVPPSVRAQRRIPVALEQIVLACLEKDPAKRPQNAEELSTRLSLLLFEEPWTDQRAQLWWSARPELLAPITNRGSAPTQSSVEVPPPSATDATRQAPEESGATVAELSGAAVGEISEARIQARRLACLKEPREPRARSMQRDASQSSPSS